MQLLIQPEPVRQTDLSAGTGNALQACVAGMFGLNLEDVPNFITLDVGYLQGIQEFVAPFFFQVRKKVLVAVPSAAAVNDDDDDDDDSDVGRLCILRGKSPRGTHGHVVVARVLRSTSDSDRCCFELLMDPHPEDSFLDQKEAYGWCLFFDKVMDS
jgi:hypothetical protein